jgi:hypothetical protein
MIFSHHFVLPPGWDGELFNGVTQFSRWLFCCLLLMPRQFGMV